MENHCNIDYGADEELKPMQLAGVDSIIQAAGRCNREGKEPAEDGFTYIFRFDERESVPGQWQQIQVAENMLQDAPDLNQPETAEKYFEI